MRVRSPHTAHRGRLHALLQQEGQQEPALKAWSLYPERPHSMSPYWALLPPLEPSQETSLPSLQWHSTCPCSLWHLGDFSFLWLSLEFATSLQNISKSRTCIVSWNLKCLVGGQNPKGMNITDMMLCTSVHDPSSETKMISIYSQIPFSSS